MPETNKTLLGAMDIVLGRFTNFAAILAADWAIVEAHMTAALSNSARDPDDGSITLSRDDVDAMKAKIAAFGSLADKMQNVTDGMVPPAAITSPLTGETSTATVTDDHHADAAAQVAGNTDAQAPKVAGDGSGNDGDSDGGSGDGSGKSKADDTGASGASAGATDGGGAGDGTVKTLAGTDVPNPLNAPGAVAPQPGAETIEGDGKNVLDKGDDGEGDSTAQGTVKNDDSAAGQAGAATVEGDGGSGQDSAGAKSKRR